MIATILIIRRLALSGDTSAVISIGTMDARFEVLAEQTGGAVFSALAGGSLFSTNTESAVVTGNVRVSNGDFLQ